MLGDLLSNHLRADFDAVEDLAVVDGNDGADQLGHDYVPVSPHARYVNRRERVERSLPIMFRRWVRHSAG